MITTLNVLGTIAAILANLAVLIGLPTYVLRCRRNGYAARHRAPELGSTMLRIVPIDTAELRVARARTEQLATQIERRAQLWDDGVRGTELGAAWLGIGGIEPGDELTEYDQDAGSPRFREVTTEALDRRITTAEMWAVTGFAPVEVDEWVGDPEPVGA